MTRLSVIAATVAFSMVTSAMAQTENNCDRLKADYPGLYYVCISNGAQERPKTPQAEPIPQKGKTKQTAQEQASLAKR